MTDEKKKHDTEWVTIPGAIMEGGIWTVERLTPQSIVDHAEQSPPLPGREGRRLCLWPDNVFAMVPDLADADELIEAYRDAWYLACLCRALDDLRWFRFVEEGRKPKSTPA